MMGHVLSRIRNASLALVAAVSLVACGRCGGAADPGASPSASAPGSAAGAPASAAAAAPASAAPDLPEIKDSGPGRATAALRAALTAYGIPFDAEAITRECKVDDDGASIDDLEDVADKYGLGVRQIIVPREHVLLPEAGLLPAIVMMEVRGEEDAVDYALAWKLDGDRVAVMDPTDGKGAIQRSAIAQRLWVDELTIAAEDWHAAETDPHYQDALRARLTGAGADAQKAQALVERAASDRASRGLGVLDAALRTIEGEPAKAGGDAAGFVGKALDCALEKRCEGAPTIPPSMWSAEPAPKGADGLAQVKVRGTLMLRIEGKKPSGP